MRQRQDVDYDAVVVGAGFSGLYMLYRLRDVLGLRVHAYERDDDVGGTWNLNRYPGARCDSDSHVYCYSFSEDLYRKWRWSRRYPTQEELLSYFRHVADRFDLRRDISFNTAVESAHFDEDANHWRIRTGNGDRVTARFLITGLGLLASATHIPDFDGLDAYEGQLLHTGAWPRDGVELAGKRVAVVGTGSTGVQVIPAVADDAAHVYVYQRTPQYVIPGRDAVRTPDFERWLDDNYDEVWRTARSSAGGYPYQHNGRSALEADPRELRETFERLWAEGGFKFLWASYQDILTDPRANELAAEFVREKNRERIGDPELAGKLIPVDHPLGSRRPVVDHGYLETFRRDNVTLVDLRETPILSFTTSGIRTADAEHEVDVVVLATGFDAVTGPFFQIDIRGRGGLSLRQKWEDRPDTLFGLATSGFPNMFMITGPGSMFGNHPVTMEHHVEWISDAIEHVLRHGFHQIETRAEAEQAWGRNVEERSRRTVAADTDSWWNGGNVPGKKRAVLFYLGHYAQYRKWCDDSAAGGYEGFDLVRIPGTDGVHEPVAGAIDT